MELLIIFIIAIILIVYGIQVYFKKVFIPKIKGTLGEYKVSLKLKRLSKKKYIVKNNLLLKNGKSTQIDHVVISGCGIFIIETKNYKGWIHGHENSEYWTQSVFKHKRKFRNPIKQNWGHVFFLKKVLSEYSRIKYYPIVVFSGSSKLKNITSSIPVIYPNRLIRTIKRDNKEQILSIDEMKNISDKLNQLSIRNKKETRKHIKQVKKQVRERRKMEKSKVCPKCGNSLIQRKGKYGKFYGCSNFPNCRYTLYN
jgi:predicted RNA-binding Zn-ribbon protein involved in translation (DUF1610 family)